jgi:uncharacterized cofD-like protein
MEKKNIVVIGGGTGTHTVLHGLKRYQKQINLTAIVTMADSGGSTGRLRDEFGVLPVGDVRMALVALASDADSHDELLRELFLYRFDKGNGLSGHNFGNLFLVALTNILGSEEEAIRAAAKVLRVQGQVIPVTTERVDLVAGYDDGEVVIGEHVIDEPEDGRSGWKIVDLAVTPPVPINPRAEEAILNADVIIVGPGDLYTSVLANCVVPGAAEAIANSPGKLVYVCNLMTKAGQTTGMSAQEHAAEIARFTRRQPDFILVNSGELPADLLSRYEGDKEFPVAIDRTKPKGKFIVESFVATEEIKTASGDVLRRSLIRHDSGKLARRIMDILGE